MQRVADFVITDRRHRGESAFVGWWCATLIANGGVLIRCGASAVT
jgi:hypothetical protein